MEAKEVDMYPKNANVVYTLSGPQFAEFVAEIERRERRRALDLATEEPLTCCKDAAKFLGLHVNTLYRRMKEGKIPFHTDGGKEYFYRSELNTYIKGKKK